MKLYNDSDSEWSFSEEDNERVDHERMVDNGSLVIDDKQLAGAALAAVSARLSSGPSRGTDRLRPSQAAASSSGLATTPRSMKKQKTSEHTPLNDDDDDPSLVSPLAKLGLYEEPLPASQQSAGSTRSGTRRPPLPHRFLNIMFHLIGKCLPPLATPNTNS